MEYEKIKNIPLYYESDEILSRDRQLKKNDIIKCFPNNFMTERLEKAIKDELLEFTTTSGTSSDRMQIMRRKNWWSDEYLRTYQSNKLLNEYLKKDKNKVILTTAICSNLVCFVTKPSYEDRIIDRTLYVNMKFNPWDWTKKEVTEIIEEINKFKPFYLDADPIYLAALILLKEKYQIEQDIYVPEVITLSYEYVTQNVKNFIKKKFNTEVLNLYGATECGYIFLEDQDGDMKECPDLINVTFDPVYEQKGIYALIIDAYKNEYMPLYNYRIGDLVEINPKQLIEYRSEKKITRLAGREKDVITNPITGNRVFITDLDDLMCKYPEVIVYQVYIIEYIKIIFRYTTENLTELSEQQKEELKESIYNLYGLKCELKLQLFIEPELSGKFALVKNE